MSPSKLKDAKVPADGIECFVCRHGDRSTRAPRNRTWFRPLFEKCFDLHTGSHWPLCSPPFAGRFFRSCTFVRL